MNPDQNDQLPRVRTTKSTLYMSSFSMTIGFQLNSQMRLGIFCEKLAFHSQYPGHLKAFNKIGAEILERRPEPLQSDDIKGDSGSVSAGEADFIASLITLNETWLRRCDPQIKQQSMEWRHSGSPRSKKFRTQKLAKKVLALVF